MELALLGWPDEGPTIRLDWRRFAYAGKFVMSATGKAVAREPGGGSGPPIATEPADASVTGSPDTPGTGTAFADDVLAAAAFNADRTDAATLWIRYVTVREDRRGEGLGPRLCAFVVDRAGDRGFDRVRIAVNNPFAYEALYRAGFAFTGEETGIAELVLARPTARPAGRDGDRYRDGLDRYRERDLSDAEAAFLARKADADPPALAGQG